MRAIWKFSVILIPAAVAVGCADQYADTDQAHPSNWVETHGAERLASQGEGCRACHGPELNGGTAGISCSECHLDAAPSGAHPADWEVTTKDHQAFAAKFSWTSCANAACHGDDLKGGDVGPSCFAAFGCHEGGPPAPHPVPYSGPEDHGRDAKANLIYCRNCHGSPPNHFDGGFIGDPLILDRGWGCSTLCHREAGAHPTFWQGADDQTAYRATHQDIRSLGVNRDRVCGRCHKSDGPGEGPVMGAPSCFSASFVNARGDTMPCHAAGPGTP